MNAVWNIQGLNSQEKIVLLAISDSVNDDGFGFPGYDRLQKKTSLSRSALSKQLKILADLQLIKTESHGSIGAGKKVNTYTISTRVLLSKSSHCELIGNIKDIRAKYSRAISSHLGKRKVATSVTISSHLEHERSFNHQLEQRSSLCENEKIKKTREKDKTPYIEIVEIYHEILPELNGIAKLTEKRKRQIKNLWDDQGENGLFEIEHWENFFTHVSKSKFLTGKVFDNTRPKPFKADLEWLTKPDNFIKISEGKYE